MWPVNSLAFHPVCVTCVCLCAVATDPRADTTSSRRRQYLKYALGVQDIAFNADGSRVAMGVSYSREHGDHDLWGLCRNGQGRYTESVQQRIVLSSRNFFAARFLLLQNFGTQVGSPCTRMQTKHMPVGPAGRVVVSVDSSGEAELGSVFNL